MAKSILCKYEERRGENKVRKSQDYTSIADSKLSRIHQVSRDGEEEGKNGRDTDDSGCEIKNLF